jgi:hypothetical protein
MEEDEIELVERLADEMGARMSARLLRKAERLVDNRSRVSDRTSG